MKSQASVGTNEIEHTADFANLQDSRRVQSKVSLELKQQQLSKDQRLPLNENLEYSLINTESEMVSSSKHLGMLLNKESHHPLSYGMPSGSILACSNPNLLPGVIVEEQEGADGP